MSPANESPKRTSAIVSSTAALTTMCFAIAWSGFTNVASADTFLDANFDVDASGFTYSDDAFRATSAPGYASGSHLPTGGEVGGGLEVRLGNIDATTVNGMSGAFARSFTLPSQTDDVEISFRYNLTQTPDYESDEFSQVMVGLDSTPLPGLGPDFVAQVVGNGNGGAPVTTGWTSYATNVGSLGPGTYALTVGGYNNKKTLGNEETTIWIDGILVAGDPVAPCVVPADCDDGNVCTDDSCDTGVCINQANTASCDDGLTCTSGDVCSAGTCGGTDLCLGNASCSVSSGLCEQLAAQALVDALSIQNFKDNIQALSSPNAPINGSRHWNQPGNSAALNFIQSQLESYGYAVERHAYSHSSQTRENIYATKVGATIPEEMMIVSGHMDSINFESPGYVFAPGANDDASGTSIVLEAARVFGHPSIVTDRSVRFILWNNEETGLNGSSAYVAGRRLLQGVESPSGSGLYPEPTWLGVIQHDMMLWDHGLPSGPTQIPGADNDIEYQASSSFAAQSLALANLVNQANVDYAPAYPGEVTNDMCCTDSVPFQNYVAAISVRENRRRAEIGNGSDPNWHANSDVFETYSEADFALGFNALQATVGAVAEIVNARAPVPCGDGILDVGEQCDDGNAIAGDCCSPLCVIESTGTVCRAAAGECDAEEACDGVADTCPADGKFIDECRSAAGSCDIAEFCDGVSNDCPVDFFESSSTECRAAVGPCDVTENCTGNQPDCPIDILLEGTPCIDGDSCTLGDVCAMGVCAGQTLLDCDDLDPCTADSCDTLTGCAHDTIEGCEPIREVPALSKAAQLLVATAIAALAGVAIGARRWKR